MLFLLLLCLGGVAPVSFSDEEVLTERVEGFADGVGLAARAQAIRNAQEEVIEKLLRSMVASGDLAPFRAILRSAPAYVRGYDLLTHRAAGDTTRIEIDAHVPLRPLQQDVAAIMLPRLKDPPSVLLVIGEQIGDDQMLGVPDFGIAETSLRKSLENLRIEVAGVDSLGTVYSHTQLIEVVNGDVQKGQDFALANAHDVTVIGTAKTTLEAGAPGTNVSRVQAAILLRVHRRGDGKLMETLSDTAAVSGTDAMTIGEQAVQDACTALLAPVAVAAVLSVLGSPAPDKVVLVAAHPGTRERLDALKYLLESEGYADEIEELLFAPELARLRFRYDGPMLPLVNLIGAHLYAGQILEVQSVVDREMHLEFRPE